MTTEPCEWIVQRCLNAFGNEYEDWTPRNELMTREEMLEQLFVAELRFPKYQFRGHNVANERPFHTAKSDNQRAVSKTAQEVPSELDAPPSLLEAGATTNAGDEGRAYQPARPSFWRERAGLLCVSVLWVIVLAFGAVLLTKV